MIIQLGDGRQNNKLVKLVHLDGFTMKGGCVCVCVYICVYTYFFNCEYTICFKP